MLDEKQRSLFLNTTRQKLERLRFVSLRRSLKYFVGRAPLSSYILHQMELVKIRWLAVEDSDRC